jgi:hypothetical protein
MATVTAHSAASTEPSAQHAAIRARTSAIFAEACVKLDRAACSRRTSRRGPRGDPMWTAALSMMRRDTPTSSLARAKRARRRTSGHGPKSPEGQPHTRTRTHGESATVSPDIWSSTEETASETSRSFTGHRTVRACSPPRCTAPSITTTPLPPISAAVASGCSGQITGADDRGPSQRQ